MKIFSGLLDFNSFESFSGLSRSQKEMSKGIPLTIGFVLVKVRLLGNCIDCSVNQMTLKNGVEMTIKKHAPSIQKVINVE